jgi:hypothetical protein
MAIASCWHSGAPWGHFEPAGRKTSRERNLARLCAKNGYSGQTAATILTCARLKHIEGA